MDTGCAYILAIVNNTAVITEVYIYIFFFAMFTFQTLFRYNCKNYFLRCTTWLFDILIHCEMIRLHNWDVWCYYIPPKTCIINGEGKLKKINTWFLMQMQKCEFSFHYKQSSFFLFLFAMRFIVFFQILCDTFSLQSTRNT